VDLALLEMAASVGCHLEHDQHGRGWVWGSGLGRVTVRFEIKDTSQGPVWTFASDDAALRRLWTWAVVGPDAGSVRVALRLGLPGVQPG
jgi:hypothetical protein